MWGWTAWKIVWRDLRSGFAPFAVAVAALAVGVGTMNAARALSAEFGTGLAAGMRQWLAADAIVMLRQAPSDEEAAALAQLARDGVEQTLALEILSTATSAQAADAALVSFGIVDPSRYPFYGAVGLEPPQPLERALLPDSVVVSRLLADKLAISPSDSIQVNGVAFRVAAILASEPDRYAAAPNAFPRALISPEAFARSRLARSGNAITWRLLLRAPARIGVARLDRTLRQLFPGARVLSSRERGDLLAAPSLDAALTVIDLIAWMALALGSTGVSVVIYLRIQQRLDTVAVMKALGGRSAQIMTIYVQQAACIGLAGAALGALLAIPIQQAILRLAEKRMVLHVAMRWQWQPAAEAVLLGMSSALLATVLPLARVRLASPMLVLRRYVERGDRPPVMRASALLSVLGMAGLAVWMLHSWKIGVAFLFGLSAGIAILMRTAYAAVRTASWAGARYSTWLPFWLRHGAINLGRPGNHGAICFLALATGAMIVTAAWRGPGAVIQAIDESLPLHGADLYAFGLGRGEADALVAFLAPNPDVRAPVGILPIAILRLSKIAGVPLGYLPRSIPERWPATCSSNAPPAAGKVVLSESIAGTLGATPGTTLEFLSGREFIVARVAGTRRLDVVEEKRSGLLFPCDAFTGLSVTYDAGIAVHAGREQAIQRAISDRFPAMALISRRDLLAEFESVARDAAFILRMMSLLVLASGTVIMVFIVAAEEQTRIADIAIRKALGARPLQLRAVLLAEFGPLGALSGIAGGIAGSGFASLLLSVVFRKAVWASDWRPLLSATALCALIAMASGCLSIARAIRLPPLEILRAVG